MKKIAVNHSKNEHLFSSYENIFHKNIKKHPRCNEYYYYYYNYKEMGLKKRVQNLRFNSL